MLRDLQNSTTHRATGNTVNIEQYNCEQPLIELAGAVQPHCIALGSHIAQLLGKSWQFAIWFSLGNTATPSPERMAHQTANTTNEAHSVPLDSFVVNQDDPCKAAKPRLCQVAFFWEQCRCHSDATVMQLCRINRVFEFLSAVSFCFRGDPCSFQLPRIPHLHWPQHRPLPEPFSVQFVSNNSKYITYINSNTPASLCALLNLA